MLPVRFFVLFVFGMKGGTDGLSIWDFLRFNNGVKRAAKQFFASCKRYREITRMTHFPPLERLPSWVKIWNPDVVSFISNCHKTYSRAFFSLEYLIITAFCIVFFASHHFASKAHTLLHQAIAVSYCSLN